MENTNKFFNMFLEKFHMILKIDPNPEKLGVPNYRPKHGTYIRLRNAFYDAYGIDYYSVPDSEADSTENIASLNDYYHHVLTTNSLHYRHEYGYPDDLNTCETPSTACPFPTSLKDLCGENASNDSINNFLREVQIHDIIQPLVFNSIVKKN